MSDEPAAPGADEPDAPGTEDEPIPPGMEDSEVADNAAEPVAVSAPQDAPADGEAAAAAAAAAPAEGSTSYPYYAQQQTVSAYPGYGEQYAGYDQYYGYWQGYGDSSGKYAPSSFRFGVTTSCDLAFRTPCRAGRAKVRLGQCMYSC